MRCFFARPFPNKCICLFSSGLIAASSFQAKETLPNRNYLDKCICKNKKRCVLCGVWTVGNTSPTLRLSITNTNFSDVYFLCFRIISFYVFDNYLLNYLYVSCHKLVEVCAIGAFFWEIPQSSFSKKGMWKQVTAYNIQYLTYNKAFLFQERKVGKHSQSQ